MHAVKLTEIPTCPICQKRLLIRRLQRERDCCYPCGRRTTLRLYCDHCSWRGRGSINGACPKCEAWGRLHLTTCGVFGHFANCGCQDEGVPDGP